jgi:hypothetical protein
MWQEVDEIIAGYTVRKYLRGQRALICPPMKQSTGRKLMAENSRYQASSRPQQYHLRCQLAVAAWR